MTEATHTPAGQRLAAFLIGGAALLELVFVSHHPVAPPGGHGGAPFAEIQAITKINLAFHAALMVILAGQLLGLVLVARRLGVHRPSVLAGLVFGLLASVMLVVAMTFDGFVTHDLLSACSASTEGCTPATGASLRVVLAVIQAFTEVGFGAQCLGFAALGLAMWVPGEWTRVPAMACVAFALAPIAVIVCSARMGPSELVEILVFLAVWGISVALMLASGSVRDRSSEQSRRG